MSQVPWRGYVDRLIGIQSNGENGRSYGFDWTYVSSSCDLILGSSARLILTSAPPK